MKNLLLKLKNLTLSRAMGKAASLLSSAVAAFGRPLMRGERASFDPQDADRLPSPLLRECGNVPETVFGVISDEFMLRSYTGALKLVPVGPLDYKEKLEGCGALLYITCWHGLSGEWRGEGAVAKAAEALRYAREKGLIALFQSIEDPSNYERFLPAAREAGHVFTACQEAVGRYIADTGNPSCHLLEYAVNPIWHNPLGSARRLSAKEGRGAFFAGSWMSRYRKRCRGLSAVFAGSRAAGVPLTIADRNSSSFGRSFPLAWQRSIVPALPHALLMKAHKLFDWNISANSIAASQSMCSMRSYELQAMATCVISTYAPSLANKFPNIFLASTASHAKEILSSYSREELFCFAAENVRIAFSCADVRLRLRDMLHAAGVPYDAGGERTLVLCTKETDRVKGMFARQIGAEADLRETADPGSERLEGYGSVCFFEEGMEYEEHYLADMRAALSYSGAEAVTAAQSLESSYERVPGPVPLSRSLALASSGISGALSSARDAFSVPPIELGSCYPARAVLPGMRKIAVVVPVCGNGRFLELRAFRSLLRSSAFPMLSILLVDDSSPDEDTRKIMRRLARRYSNVSCAFLEGGPSGSASRARNVGVEMAKEPYIAFLDPDNELVGDPYAFLLQDMQREKVPLAIGSYRKARSEAAISYLPKAGVIGDTKRSLEKERFRPHSIQACLFEASLIRDAAIQSPVGGVGQDTLFFYEAMAAAGKAHCRPKEAHIYYDERSGSATNSVGAPFFEKMLVTEARQASFLKESGLYSAYIDRRLNRFVEGWYLEKLGQAGEGEREGCLAALSSILALYGKSLGDYKKYMGQRT
jgi:hypothetical protein